MGRIVWMRGVTRLAGLLAGLLGSSGASAEPPAGPEGAERPAVTGEPPASAEPAGSAGPEGAERPAMAGEPPASAEMGAWAPEPAERAGQAAPAERAGQASPPAVVAVAPPPVPASGRRRWNNPREGRRVSGAVVAFGPTHGLGAVAEYLPHWIAGFGFGVGGSVRKIGDDAVLGAGTLFVELALLPVPWTITPVIGAGFAATMGPLAVALPGFAGKAPERDEFLRLMPYGRFGLRVDLRRHVYLVGEILLAPDNRFQQGGGTHPLPGLRIGFSAW